MKDFPHERIGLVTSGEMLVNERFLEERSIGGRNNMTSAIEDQLSKKKPVLH